MALTSLTDQCMPGRLHRVPRTCLQPASTTPEPNAQAHGAELRILHAVAVAPDVPDASAGFVAALVAAQRREERADPAVVEFVPAPLRPPRAPSTNKAGH